MAPGTGGDGDSGGGGGAVNDVPLSTSAVARRLFPLYLTHINQVSTDVVCMTSANPAGTGTMCMPGHATKPAHPSTLLQS